MYNTINEIIKKNQELGHHLFDANEKRFFRSRIGKTVYKGRYFITSEKCVIGEFSYPRTWSVRMANDDGSIDRIKEFNTRYEAIKFVKSL